MATIIAKLGGEDRRLSFDFGAKRQIDQLRNMRHEPTLMATMSRWTALAATYGKTESDEDMQALILGIDCSFIVAAVFCAHAKHANDKRFSEKDVEKWLTALEDAEGTVAIGALNASIMNALVTAIPKPEKTTEGLPPLS